MTCAVTCGVVGLGAVGATPAAAAAPAVAAVPATPTTEASTVPNPPAFVDGEVIVGFVPGTPGRARAAARASIGGRSNQRLSPLTPDAELVTLGPGRGVTQSVAALRNNPNVRFAEPNYRVETTAASNDPSYTGGQLWGMYGDTTTPANPWGSQAAEAWAANRVGSANVVVAVIDEGIDITHPDLADNVWTNPAETVNGVDDDGNGYADDINGWDFVSNDSTVYDGTADDHGTHVSGTIGGVGGNSIGVAGVNWDVTLISAKFLGASGGTTADAIRAVDYVTDLKTRHGLAIAVSSNSWGGGGFSQGLLDAINRGGDAGILFVAAAGNNGANIEGGGFYPAGYQCTTRANGTPRGWDCVVSVAAIDSTGARASFSNYGATSVDLGAPGVAITSTLPAGTYGSYNGTSMATPHVSGAIALCAAANPLLDAATLRNALLGSAAPTPSMAGVTVTGGRLDVGLMQGSCTASTEPVSGGPSGLTATTASAKTVRLDWTDGATNESFQEIEQAVATNSTCGTYSAADTVGQNTTSTVIGGLTGSTAYCFRIRAGNSFDTGNGRSVSAWSNEATATTLAPPPAFRCSATAFAWVDPTTATSRALSDDSSVSVPIGFSFPYYGDPFSDVHVASNGLLGFGAGTTAYSNTRIPTLSAPNGFAAGWWDDLNPGVGGSVRTQTIGTAPNRRFVASWLDVPIYGLSGSGITFQMILEETTGAIVTQYLDTATGNASYDRGASATVGTENADGTTGTLVSYLRASLADTTALRCSTVTTTPAPTITTTGLPGAVAQNPYSATVTVEGGTAPYSWAITSGALPAGLSLSATSGMITGAPTAGGSSTFTVRATDAEGRTASMPLTVTVDAGVMITTATLPDAGVGAAYSTSLTASGGTAPYTWSATGLPTGLSISAVGGVISGTPTIAGTSSVTVTARDAASPAGTATKAFTLTVTVPPAVTTVSLAPGTVDQALSRTLTATGGTAPLTWSLLTDPLPDGLTLSTGGVISGTPTTTGTWTFTVRVTDGVGRTDDRVLSLSVDPLLLVTTASLPPAGVGLAYSATLQATGGSGGYTWSSGSRPAGISLDPATGDLSGTPTAVSSTSFSVTVQDSAGRTSTRSLTIVVSAAPAVTTASLPSYLTGQTFSVTLTASGGAGTKLWSVAAGALPTGASLSPSGVLTGPVATAGDSPFTARVTDELGRFADRALTLIIVDPVTISTASLPQGTTGTAYSTTLAASGGKGPYSWSAVGLPAGLSLSATGTITGTPTATATASVTFSVVDSGTPTRSASRTLTLVVAAPLAITTSTLPNATLGLAYSTTLAATGGSGTRTWSVTSGSLPAGLALSTAGVLSGTPTTDGTSTFSVTVSDAFGRSATRSLTLTVTGATVRVQSIAVSRTTASNGTTARALVTVVDHRGVVVASVSVTGRWSITGSTSTTTRSGTTGSAGTVTISSPTYKSATGKTITFCVTALTKTGFTFDSSGPACGSVVA
ncbi:MAG: putative Ig domain-containing protein [Actinomycetota bacterium]